MDYKPDHSTLIDYLYGELDADTEQKVADYLAQNPEAQKELEGLQGTRNVLHRWSDTQVKPPIFMAPQSHKPSTMLRQLGRTLGRTALVAAAVIALLMILGRVLELQISYSKNQLTLSFGKVEQVEKPIAQIEPKVNQVSLDTTTMNQLISKGLENNNDSLFQYIRSLEKQWQTQLLMAQAKKENVLSSEDLPALLKQVKEDNLDLMVRLLKLADEQQKEYTEELFISFAQFLEEQRQQDLFKIGRTLNEIEEDALQTQEVTNLYLARIAKNLNNK